MLQTTFLPVISKGKSNPLKLKCMTSDVSNKVGVIPSQTRVCDSRCCKSLFSFNYKGGLSHPKASAWIQILQKPFSCPSSRGSLTNIISSGWLQMSQTTFLLSISKWGVLLTQTQVHGSRCCKRLFSCPSASGSLTQPNSSAWLQMMQMTLLLHISKRGVLPNQT